MGANEMNPETAGALFFLVVVPFTAAILIFGL
jgi:hypothetical protein